MQRAALTIAILGFFVLAGVGQLSGVGPLTCAARAAVGAAALYAIVTVAMKLALAIFVNAIMSQHQPPQARKDQSEFGQ